MPFVCHPLFYGKGPDRQAGQIRRGRVTCRVSRRGQIQRKALLCECGGRRQHGPCALLHLYRRLDKSHCEASFQMPLDVAVEYPRAWVVCHETQSSGASPFNTDCVAPDRVRLAFHDWWVQDWVAGRIIHGAIDDLHLMAMKVEWMLADITILQNDLDNAEVFEDEARRSVCRHGRGIGSESEDAQGRGHKWLVIRDQVEHGAVRAVVHRSEGDLEVDCLVSRKHRLDNDWNERGIVDIVVCIHKPQIGE